MLGSNATSIDGLASVGAGRCIVGGSKERDGTHEIHLAHHTAVAHSIAQNRCNWRPRIEPRW